MRLRPFRDSGHDKYIVGSKQPALAKTSKGRPSKANKGMPTKTSQATPTKTSQQATPTKTTQQATPTKAQEASASKPSLMESWWRSSEESARGILGSMGSLRGQSQSVASSKVRQSKARPSTMSMGSDDSAEYRAGMTRERGSLR
ncbi:hypothetical protein ElyMa_004913900, partial [Elysia marginata]